MRLVLLGCTGFIGKELVPELLKKGHEIYVIRLYLVVRSNF